jgi:prepilin-type N-terminal cleavage/methylation domain-containing protein
MNIYERHWVSGKGQPSAQTGAFTLIELLVVVLIIAILASLLLPTLANAKAKAQNAKCTSNLHELIIGWTSYANDNTDKIPLNQAGSSANYGNPVTGDETNCQPGQPDASWVLGQASNAAPDLIKHGLLYAYVGNYKVYKCPADIAMTLVDGTTILAAPVPTLRSYSMNAYMGGNWGTESGAVATPFYRLSVMALPTSQALVFVEENPMTINDGSWCQDIGCFEVEPPAGYWVDSPAHYHINAASIGFADGHTVLRSWSDKGVLGNYAQFQSGDDPTGKGNFGADPTSPDSRWVVPQCTIQQQ